MFNVQSNFRALSLGCFVHRIAKLKDIQLALITRKHGARLHPTHGSTLEYWGVTYCVNVVSNVFHGVYLALMHQESAAFSILQKDSYKYKYVTNLPLSVYSKICNFWQSAISHVCGLPEPVSCWHGTYLGIRLLNEFWYFLLSLPYRCPIIRERRHCIGMHNPPQTQRRPRFSTR